MNEDDKKSESEESIHEMEKKQARADIERLLTLSIARLRELCDRAEANLDDTPADKLDELWENVTKTGDKTRNVFASLLRITGAEELSRARRRPAEGVRALLDLLKGV